MDFTDEAAVVETVLMLEVEPVEEKTISRITKLDIAAVTEALKVLVEHYKHDPHGIEPVKIAGGWSFVPKKVYLESLKHHYGRKKEEKLSRAALETLSIIAYSQPLTKAEVENIRGVSADGMIRLLREKNLIKEVGRKDTPGRPVLYGTTKEFLKVFKLESIADLPKLDELDQKRFALNESEKQ
jgi:segregation and condensation protein B